MIAYALTARTRSNSFVYSATMVDGYQSGDHVEIEIDCQRNKMTIRNTTRGVFDSMNLPAGKQWRLQVRLHGRGDSVRIMSAKRVWA